VVEGVREDGHHDGWEGDGVGDGHDERYGVAADRDHVVVEEAVEEMADEKFELGLRARRDRDLLRFEQGEDVSVGLRKDALAAKHWLPS